jgi:hypothetical protein
MKKRNRRTEDVVLLKDLAPRGDVRGGSGKRLFGERIGKPEPPARQPDKKTRSRDKSKP